jgi:hypothetical protein
MQEVREQTRKSAGETACPTFVHGSRIMFSMRSLTLLLLCCATGAYAQNSTADQIALPADKTDADVTLTLPDAPPKGATVTVQPLSDSHGNRLSPQPAIDALEVTADTVQFHIANMYFWGGARLGVEVSGVKDPYVYTLQRGPIPAKNRIEVERGKAAVIWLYNSGTQPLTAKWRIVSGAESVCGNDANGKAHSGCGSPASQPQVTIAPAATGHIAFEAPDDWFGARDSTRRAVLELRFGTSLGTSDTAPLYPVALDLQIGGEGPEILRLWFPWAVSGLAMVFHLIWVTFGVTLGAVFLMLAQVMIPNFRKCLGMENQVERLQERMHGISAAVGNRLSTRCHQEIQRVRCGLGMNWPMAKSPFTMDGVFLSGNSEEVCRLAGILPKVESRVRLTESLDERQSAAVDADPGSMPPSLCWSREQHLRSVQSILAGQFVTDVDEKNATALLDRLADPAASLKDFTTDLELRVAGMRRLFASDPWKSKCAVIVASVGLDECADLLSRTTDAVPDGGWTMDELIRRDLAAVKLGIVNQMIELEELLGAAPEVLAGVQLKMRSSDPGVLAEANIDLAKLSQGISDQDVMAALRDGMWDALMEPATLTVTDQDVVRVTLVFRDKRLERSAAKNSFHCSWHILPDDDYEEDWDSQFLLSRGEVSIEPEVYDSVGNKLAIRSATEPDKGIFKFDVVQPPSNVRHARLLRGLLDAVITAVVPVITVALTQVQNGGTLGIDKLVLLGFTSQAIRAAVIPDSVAVTPVAPTPNAKAPAK